MPFWSRWRGLSYVAKLWPRPLTAAGLFSKWGMLFITGLSAARGKMIVYDSSYFPHATLCPLVYPHSCHIKNMAMIFAYQRPAGAS